MTNPQLLSLLRAKNACREAIDWLGTRDLALAWYECERGDWMIWGLRTLGCDDRKTWCNIAADCAERVLPIYEARDPGDTRPRVAIETLRKWLAGEATLDQVRAAAAVAAAAAAADAAYAAAYADDAAVAAAAAAAYAAYAAYADDAAACADDARLIERKAQADIVRKYVPPDVVQQLLEASKQ